MWSRILCKFGFHTGKYDTGRKIEETSTAEDGDYYAAYFLRQQRFCSECGILEMKETKTGYKHTPSWSRDLDVGSNTP